MLHAVFKDSARIIKNAIERVEKAGDGQKRVNASRLGEYVSVGGDNQTVMFIIGEVANSGHDSLIAVYQFD